MATNSLHVLITLVYCMHITFGQTVDVIALGSPFQIQVNGRDACVAQHKVRSFEHILAGHQLEVKGTFAVTNRQDVEQWIQRQIEAGRHLFGCDDEVVPFDIKDESKFPEWGPPASGNQNSNPPQKGASATSAMHASSIKWAHVPKKNSPPVPVNPKSNPQSIPQQEGVPDVVTWASVKKKRYRAKNLPPTAHKEHYNMIQPVDTDDFLYGGIMLWSGTMMMVMVCMCCGGAIALVSCGLLYFYRLQEAKKRTEVYDIEQQMQ